MLEVHGVTNTKRIGVTAVDQTVTVSDMAGFVALDMDKPYGAKLTVEEARTLAKFLVQSARRVARG